MVEKRTERNDNASAVLALSKGRSLEEQIEYIEKWGNHGVPSALRESLLNALGLPPPKEKAENVVVFGCYIPFSLPFLIRDYTRLFDLLGIDYTYLDKEYCCGAPLRVQFPKQDSAIDASAEAIRTNGKNALLKGARNVAYCCIGCAHIGKVVSPEEADAHLYVLDLVIEKLMDKSLNIAPMKLGYFEGCHCDYSSMYPDVRINWEGYREALGRINGLDIVDLSNDNCCKRGSDKIFENARQLGVDKLLCACNGCTNYLGRAAKGKIELLTFPGIILKGLEGK